MKKVTGSLKIDLAQYRALEAFALFASDLDAASQAVSWPAVRAADGTPVQAAAVLAVPGRRTRWSRSGLGTTGQLDSRCPMWTDVLPVRARVPRPPAPQHRRCSSTIRRDATSPRPTTRPPRWRRRWPRSRTSSRPAPVRACSPGTRSPSRSNDRGHRAASEIAPAEALTRGTTFRDRLTIGRLGRVGATWERSRSA